MSAHSQSTIAQHIGQHVDRESADRCWPWDKLAVGRYGDQESANIWYRVTCRSSFGWYCRPRGAQITQDPLGDKLMKINTFLTELWDLRFCLLFKGFYLVQQVQKLTNQKRVHLLTWSGKKNRVSLFFVESPDFFMSLQIFFHQG